jgi:hypothetical protein
VPSKRLYGTFKGKILLYVGNSFGYKGELHVSGTLGVFISFWQKQSEMKIIRKSQCRTLFISSIYEAKKNIILYVLIATFDCVLRY